MNRPTFIRRIANHIKEHYDLKHDELTVVFPNKRAAFYLRSEFKRQCNTSIWLPQMLSIQEAVEQWSGMHIADNIDVLFELIDINAQLHSETQCDLLLFGSQAAQMASDFDEIDQYDADAAHVFSYVEAHKKLEIWNLDEHSTEKEQHYLQFFASLILYYNALRERLTGMEKGYYGMITRHLAHLDDATLISRLKGRKVLFAGFNALTATEEALIDKMVKNGCAEVLFDFDRYYVENEHNEAGLFARRYQKNHPDWFKQGFQDKLLTEEKHIRLISTNGNTLQVKALQNLLAGAPSKQCAVVLADENLLIPVLNAIPDEESYQSLMVSMGYPLQQAALSHLVTAFFKLRSNKKIVRKSDGDKTIEGWYVWPIYRIMDLEIARILFTPGELSRYNKWRNTAQQNGIYLFGGNELQELQSVPAIADFIRLLIEASDATHPTDILASLSRLMQFIAQKLQSLPDNNKMLFLLNQVSETGQIVNRLTAIASRHEHFVQDIESVEVLYQLVSRGSHIKLSSSTTDGLQIMGILETRNLDFDTLHVLSVNEGVIPTEKSQNSFIPNYIKRENQLPGYQEKQAVFAYHFYHLLQSSNDIYLYYNAADASSGGEASRFILQMKHELLPRNKKIALEEYYFPNGKGDKTETHPLNAEKSPAVIEALKAKMGSANGLAPTSLSTYISCPLKFYLKYIARIEDNSMEEDLQSNVTGTIVHSTLERMFSDYLPQGNTTQLIGTELFCKAIEPSWQRCFDEAVQKELPAGLPDIGYNYLNRVIMDEIITAFIEYEKKETVKPIEILQLEQPLSTTLVVNGTTCKIMGYADRIDRTQGKIRIIDYKTGRVADDDVKVRQTATGGTPTDIRDIPEKALQLLLYKYMYLQEHPGIRPDDIDAAIFGLRYNKILFQLRVEHEPLTSAFISTMEQWLTELFAEMLDEKKPFVQCENEKPCRNCDFKKLCKR